MSQRVSGYTRNYRDLYETPAWVTELLLPHLPSRLRVWEPACGSGKMVAALSAGSHYVEGTDLSIGGRDFLLESSAPMPGDCNAIITNPPYELAQQFIEHALPMAPIVAMLLRTDFDHAITRQHLFGRCPSFAKKIVLTKRIKWFEDSTGSPSFNHAWFIWNRDGLLPPTIAYEPSGTVVRLPA